MKPRWLTSTVLGIDAVGDSISSLVVGWLWTGFNPGAGFGFAFVLMAAVAGL